MFRILLHHCIVSMLFFVASPIVIYADDPRILYEEGQRLANEGNHLEAARKFQACAEIIEKTDALKAQSVLSTAGVMFLLGEEPSTALDVLEKALAISKETPDDVLFSLKMHLSNACRKLEQNGRAAEFAIEALKLGATRPEAEIAMLHARAAESMLCIEAYQQAIDHVNATLDYFVKEDPERAAMLLVIIGSSKLKLGDFDGAHKALLDAWALRDKHQNIRNHAEIISNRGLVTLYQGDYGTALEFFQQAQTIEEGADLKENLGADLNNEGLVWRSLNNYEKAITCFETALNIAKNINNFKDEAIALSNRALIRRLQGRYEEAQTDYMTALKAFETIGYKDGVAVSHLGLAKLVQIGEKNYKSAWNHAEKALALYEEIHNAAGKVDAMNILAFLIKEGNNEKSSTRDLVFEENGPVYLDMNQDESLGKMCELLNESLVLAKAQQNLEKIWECHQGLGYAEWKAGNLEDALEHYKTAIDTVTAIRKGPSDASLAGNYFKNKRDLFDEAILVICELSQKKEDLNLTNLQLSWSDTMINEIVKSATQQASLQFEDAEKQKHKNTLDTLQIRRDKLEQEYGNTADTGTEAEPSQDIEAMHHIRAEERRSLESAIKMLDGEFNEKLKEWKKEYPKDSDLYDTAAKIDVPTIQTKLKPNQAMLHCFPLGDGKSVLLSAISATDDMTVQSNVPEEYGTIATFVVEKLSNQLIEKGARGLKEKTPEEKSEEIKKFAELFHDAYTFIYEPVADVLDAPEVEEIIVVAYKDLVYLPVCAFKRSSNPETLDYIVQEKATSYTRLKYFLAPSEKTQETNSGGFLGVANPIHHQLSKPEEGNYPLLAGATSEVEIVTSYLSNNNMNLETIIEKSATECAFRESVSKKPTILYLATHGYPYADYYKTFEGKPVNNSTWVNMRDFQKRFGIDEGFLGGYLLLADCPVADENTRTSAQDGMLTLKEIMGMDVAGFDLVVLSACNSSVEFASKVDETTRQTLAKRRDELRDKGWEPGIDQIAFSDAFLRIGASGVLGTLWFVDDESTQAVVSEYFKNRDMGDSKSLQQAMLTYIDDIRTKPQTEHYLLHPFFWAPYSYTFK